VIKPKPVQPAVEGGFTCDDFTVDERAGTVTCPAGRTRPLSPSRTATFGALCRDCPLTPIFAQRFSPQVAGSRRVCQAYS
jgi:hypothetical protein